MTFSTTSTKSGCARPRAEHGIVALGTAAGTIGAGLAARALSWRAFFLIPALLMAFMAVALGRVPESLSARSSQNPFEQITLVLRQPWSLFLLALAILVGAVMFGFLTYFGPALEPNGQSAAVAGTVVAGYGLSVLICTRAFGWVARRVAIPIILAGGAVMRLLGYLIAAARQNLPAILAGSVLAGGAYAFIQSTFQTWATDIVPEARATAILAGAALATSAVAGLASAHRYSMLFLIAAIITVPVLVAGTRGRWRYSAVPIPVSPQPGAIT